jgi:probable F420-dependent oxidoreductase
MADFDQLPGKELNMRPFRFGVHVHAHTSRDAWLSTCRTAEQLGFAVLTVPDHIGPEGGVWAALATAALVTERLRVGPLVLNSDYWNPAILSREAATTDLLSGGRLELGLGAGWNRADYAAAGLTMPPASERIEKLAESVRVLRAGFEGKPLHITGRYHKLDSESPWCVPQQRPLPILIGGGCRRVLSLAGAVADIVSINRNLRHGSAAAPTAGLAAQQGLYEQDLQAKLAWVSAAAAGRPTQPELHTFILRAVPTSSRRDAAEEVGRAYGVGPDDALASPHFLIGTNHEMAEDLRQRRERWGFSYFTVREESMSALAPVVRELTGT